MVSSFERFRPPNREHTADRGFVLIAMSVALMLLVAMMGLAFDVGRIYIARNEAQVFTDAAAMTAAAKLDGTPAGIAHAREAVGKLPIRWNLGTTLFTGVVVEFSSGDGHWDADPKEAQGLTVARVTAPSNNVDIVFLRAVGGPASFTVPARSAAASDPGRLTE